MKLTYKYDGLNHTREDKMLTVNNTSEAMNIMMNVESFVTDTSYSVGSTAYVV